jgi:hypothetical protein
VIEPPVIVPRDRRPAGHRAVPLLVEHDLGHYPEFRAFLAVTFDLSRDPFGPPGLLRVGDRIYQLVFFGRSGRAFPAGVSIDALIEGLEPLDEASAERDLWVILQWLVTGAGRPWADGALAKAGRIYRIAAAGNRFLDASEK